MSQPIEAMEKLHRHSPQILGIFCLCLVSVLPCPLLAFQTAVQINLADGSSFEGALKSFDIDDFVVEENGNEKRVRLDDAANVTFDNEAVTPDPDAIKIELIDQSSLNAQAVSIDEGKLTAELANGTQIEISTRFVAFVQFRNYENQVELSRQWKSILAAKDREGDVIVVNRSKELDTVEGVIGGLSDDKVAFSVGDQTARVALSKIEAMIFYHAAGKEIARPVCEVCLTDGSVLKAHRLALKDSALQATGLTGVKSSIPFAKLLRLDFAFGRDVYLSQLTPSTNDWEPLMTSSSIIEQLRKLKLARKNKSVSGQPLTLKFYAEDNELLPARLKQFENGFAINGGGKLAFSVNRQYTKMTGWVGFDPEANPGGNVTFRILLDGKAMLEKELIHRTMKSPVKLDIDISDVDRIVFAVDYRDGRSIGDQLHLVDLKVSQ